MSAQEEEDEGTGKKETMLLDTGENPSYINNWTKIPTIQTRETQITTPNDKMRTNRAANLNLKTPYKKLKFKEMVHDRLPNNLLSVTPIVERLGALLLDKEGAALLTRKAYKNIQHELAYFRVGRRHNKIYQVPIDNGNVKLGTKTKSADPASASQPQVNMPRKCELRQYIYPEQVRVKEQQQHTKPTASAKEAVCLGVQEEDQVYMSNKAQQGPEQQVRQAERRRTGESSTRPEQQWRKAEDNSHCLAWQAGTLIPLRANAKEAKFGTGNTP